MYRQLAFPCFGAVDNGRRLVDRSGTNIVRQRLYQGCGDLHGEPQGHRRCEHADTRWNLRERNTDGRRQCHRLRHPRFAANGSTITSHGLFSLDSQSVNGAGYAEVEGGSNPDVSLKNSGTFETLGGTIEPDYIGVDLTNDGTVSIAGASTEENTYATVVNEGAFTVTSSGNLTESNSGSDTSFTQQSGTLVNDGKMVFVGATFTESGGTESGNPVQLTQFSSLIDSAGSGKFTVTGNGSLTGTIPVGQSITVVGHTTSGALTLVGNVTNDGTLTLKDKSTSVSAELSNGSVSGTTLINNGTFKTKGAAGEADDIDADLTNDSGGTVATTAALTNEVAYANITNNGTFTIGSSGALDVDRR